MPNYRRAFVPGGIWFFTVNLLQRRNNNLLVREIDLLRQCVHRVQQRYPFQIDAWVVLPEHLHCVLTLPPDDYDFSLRWRLIKSCFSRALPKTEHVSDVRKAAGERGIWQRHFWEHLIRDEIDYQR
ncbi:MAG TPA: transposase, partial [Gammaproteobacteria bacterium]